MHALLFTAWLACQSLDGGTTAYALHSHRFVEGNPAMRGPQLYALKLSVNVGAFVWERHLPKEQQAIIPLALAIAGCAASGWNLHQLTQSSPRP